MIYKHSRWCLKNANQQRSQNSNHGNNMMHWLQASKSHYLLELHTTVSPINNGGKQDGSLLDCRTAATKRSRGSPMIGSRVRGKHPQWIGTACWRPWMSMVSDELRKFMGSSLLVALALSSSAGSWSVRHNEIRVTWGSGLHGYQHSTEYVQSSCTYSTAQDS